MNKSKEIVLTLEDDKKHFIELFISNDEIDKKKVNKILLENKILCNIYFLNSVVFNKKENKHKVESGFKVDIFEISNKDLLNLYFSMRKNLKVNCVWLNVDKNLYNGCISKYKPYKFIMDRLKINCSEY